MLSSKSKQGRKLADRGNPVLSQEAVKLLKTQDSGYLRTMLQKTRRALEKREQEFILHEGQGAELLGSSRNSDQGQHVLFVVSREEQKQRLRGKGIAIPNDVEQGLKDHTEIDGLDPADVSLASSTVRKSNSRRALEREELAKKEETVLRKKHKKEQEARRSKLTALKAREKDLMDAENELELQRAKMSNSVGGVTKAGLKWKVRERKK